MLTNEDLSLGYGEWFLHGRDKITYRINISYDDPAAESIFRDFRPIAGRMTALTQPAIPLLDFLGPFHDVNSRWGDYYEPLVVDIIRECAVFQSALLSRRSALPVRSSNGSILIALSLRCLVLTHEIYLAGSAMVEAISGKKKMQNPSVEVLKILNVSQVSFVDSEQKGKESLLSILKEILQTTQRSMFRRKPKDWPLLLCTLLLFKLITNDMSCCSSLWSPSLRSACDVMISVFSTLCRLYDICSKGLHSLSDNWKREEYAKLVDHDETLVGCFQRMNDLWLQGTRI